jgi:hypothetical protein|tara:strand:+ start:662 stop:1390 length:729 start_codon:yes stop_codon:yes gene_type:complete
MSLANIRKKAKQKPPRIVLYGGAGIGKTFFAASMNKPIFVLTEDGMGKIEADHFPLSESFEDVLKNLQSLIDNENDYKTLVVDSLDWLEPLIWDKACQDNNFKSIESVGYGKGYVEALKYWRIYLNLLNELREKGYTIMQIAHNQIKRFESPEIEAYDRHELKLHRKAADLILEHSDCCFFANFKLGTVQVKGKGGTMTTKAVAGDRVVYTVEKPAYLAKNRYALPESLPFDWETVRAEMLK